MKVDNQVETRTIHPDVMKDMTIEAAIAMLEVARDLRNGTIPDHLFYMDSFTSGVSRSWYLIGLAGQE